ncbi:hypothetical protein AZE42_07520 [Rhizopogon vesiculosus]|uniref:Uncharacterized protein n=1 Tax=Rhizopogon vesiculosus TaxID=180088 RepID=A0A1J8QUH8_9AGAM|nr:hypothetical protein AZE42_07520 [Rhizopogon vesiculosus]
MFSRAPELSLFVQEVFSKRPAEAPSSQHQSESESVSKVTVTGEKVADLKEIQLSLSQKNSDVVHVPSIVSALGRRKTEEFLIDSPGSVNVECPCYRSRAPSPDPFLDVGHAADESVSPSPTLRLGSLAPNCSAPLLISPRRLPDANSHSGSYGPRAISSTSALITLNSHRALAPAPTILLLLGITPTSSFASSSKISQPINPLVSGNASSSSFASSSNILRTSTRPVAISGKSSLSQSEERRKRQEIAEKPDRFPLRFTCGTFISEYPRLKKLEVIGLELQFLPPLLHCIRNLESFEVLQCDGCNLVGRHLPPSFKLLIVSISQTMISPSQCKWLFPPSCQSIESLEVQEVSACLTSLANVIGRFVKKLHIKRVVCWTTTTSDRETVAVISGFVNLRSLRIDGPDLPTEILHDFIR